MTADVIWDLAGRLDLDKEFHADYMITKMGLDPWNAKEMMQGIRILEKKHLVEKTDEGTYTMWP